MKKILQRIGLLAAAVMLLWGWQGMEAKAAEPSFTFEYKNPDDQKYINKAELEKGDNGYYFYLCLNTGNIFKQTPGVGLKATSSGIEVEPDRQQAFGKKCYTYFTSNQAEPNQSYRIIIYDISSCIEQVKEISVVDIEVVPPTAGVQLPSEWKINTEGVAVEGKLIWKKAVGDEEVTGIAEPNTGYNAWITLSTKENYILVSDAVVNPSNNLQTNRITDGNTKITCIYSFTTGDIQSPNPGNTNTEITWEKWNDWTINRDKLENGHIAKGYGLSGSAAESHDAHLFLYVEPKDGYYFTEEPKVSWNDTLLVPLPKDSSTLYGYKYQLDDNGKGTIFVEGKAVKKDTAEPQTNEPQANTSQSSNDTYKIINGAKSTWNGSTTEGLTIRGDGDFAKFAGVRVDGNWIPSAHYEAKSGSTIVTLKPSYLASLAEGEHTVDIMWIDDSASTTFTVAANTAAAQPELDSVPKTGEGVMGWMPEILLLAAAGLVTFGGILRRRSKIHL